MIIDTHTHIFPKEFSKERKQYIALDSTFAEMYANPKAKIANSIDLIENMNKTKINKSITLGIGWNNISLAIKSNNYLLKTQSDYPNRILAFCSINPNWKENALKEIERCAINGAVGIGELHPDSQQFSLSNIELLSPIMKLAKELNLIILIHASEPVGHQYAGKGKTTPDKLMTLIENFPDNQIICAHWGGGLPFYGLMPEIKSSLKNVYFDSAASPFLYETNIFDLIPECINPENILFGSDFPLIKPDRYIKIINNSNLKKNIIKNILGNNANKLFSRK